MIVDYRDKSEHDITNMGADTGNNAPRGEDSLLFKPMKLGGGRIELQHRVIQAPMTRNRGTPLNPVSTPGNPNRIWYPSDLMAKFYNQRATKGGLIISEGIAPSLEVGVLFSAPFLRSDNFSWYPV